MTTHLTKMPTGRPKGSRSFNKKLAKAFGLALRRMRLKKRYSQNELAYIAGIQGNHIGKIERGENLPNLALIFKVCDAMKVLPGTLVNEANRIFNGDMSLPPDIDSEMEE